ncbi:MAG: TRAP transporter small permease [Myxococcales bacterium]|nr:TRAP transporter small permease [Myxococcales bacterium]
MRALERLNHVVFQVERAIVVVSLLVMSVVVFLSVAHRRYADPDSVLADKIAKMLGAERGDETWQALQGVAGPLSLVLLGGLVYLGFRTASRRPLWGPGREKAPHGEPRPHLQCLLYTVITLLVSWGLMVLLFGTGSISQSECIELRLAGDYSFACGRFPSGLNWAQPFALILTLWVSFIGASMATKENLHLKVEAVQHALPEKLQRISGLISGLLTAVFCLLLAYLAWSWSMDKYEEWQLYDGLGGLHDGIDIPQFLSFLVVPVAYVVMTARFVGLGVLSMRGELEKTPAELRDLEKKQEGPPESEKETVDAADDDGEAAR